MERTFLIGLRAQKPETRQKFFALYNELVPKTIFDRLKYIFMDQDWERLSHTFWLKQAQVRAILLPAAHLASQKQSDLWVAVHSTQSGCYWYQHGVTLNASGQAQQAMNWTRR